jgi:hypothetical protein
VTGLIGHLNKAHYRISTPTATIGIHGTDHEPMYIPKADSGQRAQGAPGTYDKVNSGGVYIQTAAGSVDVKPNEVGFAPIAPNVAPMILHEIPRFYHAGRGVESTHGFPDAHGHDKASRDAGDRSPMSEHHRSPEHHMPEVQAPAVDGSGTHVPDAQPVDSQAPAPQAPVIQEPAAPVPETVAPAETHEPATQTTTVPTIEAPDN